MITTTKEAQILENILSKYNMNIQALNQKKEHTYRVAMYSRMLASYQNLSIKEQDRAFAIGLLHDIGRFPQYMAYQTFNDSQSIDHAKLAYDMLEDMGYEDEIVKKSILAHNKLYIPTDYEGLLKQHCEIIRDADKLDNLNYDFKPNYVGLKINEDLIKYFRYHSLIPNEVVKNQLDAGLRELSFVFDVNYVETLNLIKLAGMIDKKIDEIYNQTRDTTIFMIGAYINEYIRERIGVKKYERIRQEI